ncbi:hypothetical protein CHLNCDRAFT_135213 [Chlorella variabilis]|uniref:Strictosidine synthase conserved region domain-containing protein n=1 Tax=Chlorella variabilis TaxID=554065 RepID=E1ZHR0_CHLVA|nr:hypothetical protein CHLNCDRAFT_135213 [Chlorella variabilis]EFN54503.1 hypothetical protein CHLNCDRAFT_135213 [Chlorella variabilis]|eukprot:XP_005846605.1 hypothetical protein CHLNCDRAFT_135213 [Chlorella variabilis]
MAMHPDGHLIVCDAAKGLLSADPASGEVSLLASRLPNASLTPAEADIGAPQGRLLVYDPRTHYTQQLADGIWFAKGVALSDNESYVLVAETFGCRVLRHWLQGPAAGTTEVFVDGLPGFPDGISRAPGGDSYWLTIISTPSPLAKALPSSQLLRWLVAWLPKALNPKPTHVSSDGRILRSLHDPTGGRCHTSAAQVGGTLYMGSLASSHVCALDLAAAI